MKKSCIVVPYFYGGDSFTRCVQSLLKDVSTLENVTVVVVNNSPDDPLPKLLAENANPAIVLLQAPFNLGFSGAINYGMSVVDSEFVFWLNQDAVVHPGWAKALLMRLEQSPKIGIVGSKCLYRDGTVEHAGGVVLRPLFYAEHLSGRTVGARPDEASQCDYVTGAALVVRREVIDRIGGLDPGFYPGYYEDVDFCLRARAAGFEVWYEPTAVVTHEGRISDEVHFQARVHRGRLRCMVKHTSPRILGQVLREVEAPSVPAEARSDLHLARALAYRGILRAHIQGDPVFAALTLDAIDGLMHCYNFAVQATFTSFAKQVSQSSAIIRKRVRDLLNQQDSSQVLSEAVDHLNELLDGISKLAVGVEALVALDHDEVLSVLVAKRMKLVDSLFYKAVSSGSLEKDVDAEKVVELRGADAYAEEFISAINSGVARQRERANAKGIAFDQIALGDIVPSGRSIALVQLRESLMRAELLHSRLRVNEYLSPVRMPLLNMLLRPIRRVAHRLVIYYTNRLADKQAAFNAEIIVLLGHIIKLLKVLTEKNVD